MTGVTSVELTHEDAQRFLQFQEHYTVFKGMIDSGLADMKAGKMIVHFDQDGKPRSIQVDRIMMKL